MAFSSLICRQVSTPDEIEQLRLLRNTCARFMTRHRELLSPDQQLQWWNSPVRTTEYRCYLFYWGTDSTTPVGLGVIHEPPNSQQSWITVGLAPEHRNQGLGKPLSQQVVQKCRFIPHAAFHRWNQPSIQVARSLGFEPIPGNDTSEIMEMKIPQIPLFQVKMTEAAIEAAVRTLRSGYIGQGPRVDEFERKLEPWLGSPHVLTTNSGTSAIHLALRLAGVGPGDEVISTPMTCSATNMPILERGARIVWGDVDPHTGNLDPKDVEKKITAKTRAILMVHWGGTPCEIDAFTQIGRRHGIAIIEDAAHALGATYHDQPIGSHSDFVAFSFQAIKHLTTGDGGALVCRSRADYERGKKLRWFGIDRDAKTQDFRCEEDILEHGYKFHMNDIAASIGVAQLEELPKTLQKHRENAEFFRETLQNIPGIELLRRDSDRQSAFWLFTLKTQNRDRFVRALSARGIVCSQVHVRNDRFSVFAPFRAHLPGLDEFSAHQVNIPVGGWLTPVHRSRIVECICECIREAAPEATHSQPTAPSPEVSL